MKKIQAVFLTLLIGILSSCSYSKTNDDILIQDVIQVSNYETAYLKTIVLKYDEIASHPRFKLLSAVKLDPRYEIIILECCNFPKNQEYTIFECRMAQRNQNQFKEIFRFVPLENGMWYSNQNYSVPYFYISPSVYAGGEKTTLRVQSKSGTFRKEIDLVPLPIHIESKNKEFSLDATLVS